MADELRHAEQPADDTNSLDDLIDTDIAPHRMQAALIGSLALLALVIASVGIYGLMAYLVSPRTKETGIRMALGAQQRDIMMLIVSGGAKIALAVWPSAALPQWVDSLMQSLLFKVSAADRSILVSIGAILTFVTLAACVFSVRRAALDRSTHFRRNAGYCELFSFAGFSSCPLFKARVSHLSVT